MPHERIGGCINFLPSPPCPVTLGECPVSHLVKFWVNKIEIYPSIPTEEVLFHPSGPLVGGYGSYGGRARLLKSAALPSFGSDFAKQLFFGLPLLREITELEGQTWLGRKLITKSTH